MFPRWYTFFAASRQIDWFWSVGFHKLQLRGECYPKTFPPNGSIKTTTFPLSFHTHKYGPRQKWNSFFDLIRSCITQRMISENHWFEFLRDVFSLHSIYHYFFIMLCFLTSLSPTFLSKSGSILYYPTGSLKYFTKAKYVLHLSGYIYVPSSNYQRLYI